MACRTSIFDFASKELSATAFWAWILDAERSDDVSLWPLNKDLRLKLDVPLDAELESIELEKNPDDPGLKLLTRLETDEGDLPRKRIDILATYRMSDGSFLRLVIENKVRRDPKAIEQVMDYRNRLKKRVVGPVRAVVFTFDDALASSALATEGSVDILTLSEMVALIGSHAPCNAILQDYHRFLQGKLIIASASPVRGSGDGDPGNLARWSVVADQRGIQSLLEMYRACAEKYGFAIRHSKGRSIFLTIDRGSPVISVHPMNSSPADGLWFGVSVTNLSQVHNIDLARAAMPSDFAWKPVRQGDNEWRFGYVGADRIEPTLRMISDALPKN